MVVWLHGASVGELNSAFPLIDRLTKDLPNGAVLVTTGTVTSSRLAADRLPAPALHQFVPLDQPTWVGRFLDHWQPGLSLWLESEFWPNLITETHRRRIPMVLLNARVSDRSLQRWHRLPGLIGPLIRSFDLCLAPDEDQAERLRRLGAPSIRVVGNLKDAASALIVDEESHRLLGRDLAGRNAWLAASTHPGEEASVAEVHIRLREQFPALLTIIVPRHPERGAQIAQRLAARGLVCSRRSRNEKVSRQTDIYIADTLGELGLFYRLVDVAFVGGSLVPHGGQNMAEAARHGCAIICGPHTQNFAAVARRLTDAQAMTTVDGADALATEVMRLLEDHDLTIRRAAAAKHVADDDAAAGRRALESTMTAIQPYLPGESGSSNAAASNQQAHPRAST